MTTCWKRISDVPIEHVDSTLPCEVTASRFQDICDSSPRGKSCRFNKQYTVYQREKNTSSQNTIQVQCGIEYWYWVPAYKCKIARILRYQQFIRWIIRWFSQLRSSATLPTCSSQVHASGRRCLLWWLSLAKKSKDQLVYVNIYIYTVYTNTVSHTHIYRLPLLCIFVKLTHGSNSKWSPWLHWVDLRCDFLVSLAWKFSFWWSFSQTWNQRATHDNANNPFNIFSQYNIPPKGINVLLYDMTKAPLHKYYCTIHIFVCMQNCC